MHIKKFTGKTAKDALAAVKAEFGGEALIMSSKRTATGLCEVVAAMDYDLSRPIDTPRDPLRRAGGAGGERRSSLHAAGSALELKRELRELKEVKELFKMAISRSDAPVARLFDRLEQELNSNGIDRRLARKILVNAFNGVSKNKAADIVELKAYMKERMMSKVKVTDPLASRSVVAFVGPTGVGKTTTIAKLAAINALKKKRRTALLTMDTYRIAASEQLKTYGRIIGVPVEVARTPRELASQISHHSDKELILIDTAGRSRKDNAHMGEIAEMSRLAPEMKFNLVLSSQTRDDALYDSVRSFGASRIDSLTFTKLDEGDVYGPILNTMLHAGKPVAYLTNGQKVPEDIEAASKERLADFFMPN